MDRSSRVLCRFLALALAGAYILAPPAARAGEEKINAVTQQTYEQWQGKLAEAEAASKAGSDPAQALPVLEACDAWFAEKQLTLEKHPEFKAGYTRQLLLRIKLARIVAFSGLAAAEAAVKQQRADLLDGKGGAYEQLGRADGIAQSLVSVLGKEQKPVQDLLAYIQQVRDKVEEKAGSIKSGGGAEGISTTVPAGGKLDPFVRQTFEKWVANISADRAVLAGDKTTVEKIRELDGGRSWYLSNRRELAKHPNYEQAMPQMSELMLRLAELKAQRAVELAEQGLADMNPNLFNETAGTFQQLREAERLVADFGQGADPAKANAAIARAKTSVQALGDQYSGKSAASFRLPKDAYAGADKDALGKQVLAKWKEEYPQDQILGIRFVKPNWERRKESTFKNGKWHDDDNSALLVYVVVKKSAELATVYPAYVNKDNLTGAITVGAETKGSGYSHQDMLIKNIEP